MKCDFDSLLDIQKKCIVPEEEMTEVLAGNLHTLWYKMRDDYFGYGKTYSKSTVPDIIFWKSVICAIEDNVGMNSSYYRQYTDHSVIRWNGFTGCLTDRQVGWLRRRLIGESSDYFALICSEAIGKFFGGASLTDIPTLITSEKTKEFYEFLRDETIRILMNSDLYGYYGTHYFNDSFFKGKPYILRQFKILDVDFISPWNPGVTSHQFWHGPFGNEITLTVRDGRDGKVKKISENDNWNLFVSEDDLNAHLDLVREKNRESQSTFITSTAREIERTERQLKDLKKKYRERKALYVEFDEKFNEKTKNRQIWRKV